MRGFWKLCFQYTNIEEEISIKNRDIQYSVNNLHNIVR